MHNAIKLLKVKKVLFFLIGLIVAGLAVGLVRYGGFMKEPGGLIAVLPKGKDASLNHIHHVATRDGVREWVLEADSAHHQMAGNKTVIKEVSATFFLTDGKTAHLTGRSGVFLMDTKDMEVSGDVVVRSGQYELRTAKLSYDHKSRSISTDTPILVKGEGIHLTGHSMIFSLNTEEVLVKGSVEAVFESWRL